MKTITTPKGKILVDESAEIKEGDYFLYNKAHSTRKFDWVLLKCHTVHYMSGVGVF